MVSTEEAPERVRRLLEREKSAHAHPLVSSYYRILANWPEFLDASWTRIEPVVGSGPFRERIDSLVQLASGAAARLPLAGGIRGAERTDEISDVLAAFRREFIPSMMIAVALIKAMVDGPEAARRSRISVAAEPLR